MAPVHSRLNPCHPPPRSAVCAACQHANMRRGLPPRALTPGRSLPVHRQARRARWRWLGADSSDTRAVFRRCQGNGACFGFGDFGAVEAAERRSCRCQGVRRHPLACRVRVARAQSTHLGSKPSGLVSCAPHPRPPILPFSIPTHFPFQPILKGISARSVLHQG